MNIFIICPVRNLAPQVRQRLLEYAEALEAKGKYVYLPFRDTDQDDPVGLSICMTNAIALRVANQVHIWHDPTSQGSIFDLGALVMSSLITGPKKRVVLINPEDVQPTPHKSFTNVVLALAAKSHRR